MEVAGVDRLDFVIRSDNLGDKLAVFCIDLHSSARICLAITYAKICFDIGSSVCVIGQAVAASKSDRDLLSAVPIPWLSRLKHDSLGIP